MKLKEYEHLKEYYEENPPDWMPYEEFTHRKVAITDEPIIRYKNNYILVRIFEIMSKSTNSSSRWSTKRAKVMGKAPKKHYKKEKSKDGKPISLHDPSSIPEEEHNDLEKTIKDYDPDVKKVLFN